MNPEKPILTFEEILGREDHVICDSSISSTYYSNWYFDGVYKARNFAGINQESTELEVSHLNYFIRFLQNPKVFVARGVSLQIQRARDMVADKIRYLKKEEKKEREKRHQNGENKKNIIQEVHDLLHESYLETKRVSFLPKQKQKYGTLERIVMDITEKTGAKIDLDEIYERRAKPKNLEDFHANEQTAAAALYLSSIENKNGCILTRDSDIERILTNTINYLFYSRNKQINRLWGITKKNGIKIYFVSDFQKARLSFDSSIFLPSPKIPGKIIDDVDEEIKKNPETVL